MSWPSKLTSPETRRRFNQSGERFDQLGLAVAFDAGDADDLAGAHLEGNVVHASGAIRLSGTDRLRTVSFVSPGFAAGLSTRSSTSRPTIRRASSAAFVSAGLQPADDAAVAHDRHLVGYREHLGQLVRDDDDRLSLLAHAPEDDEEFLDFLRRQHGRRLIENQQPRVAVERFQQLDPLLLADRKRVDDRMRIDGQLELVGQPADVGGRCREIERQRRARLRSQHDVFRHRHRPDQHEMLMDHADAERDRIVRRGNLARRARQSGSRRCPPV